MTIGFLVSFLLYIPVNLAVKRFGKRLPMLVAFIVFALSFILTASSSALPWSMDLTFYTLAVASALPLAIFGIIPNALIADFIYAHEERTGQQQAGMFYAVRNFMMKMGVGLAGFMFPSFLLLGNSLENPSGVVYSALAAAVFCLAGFVLFWRMDSQNAVK